MSHNIYRNTPNLERIFNVQDTIPKKLCCFWFGDRAPSFDLMKDRFFSTFWEHHSPDRWELNLYTSEDLLMWAKDPSFKTAIPIQDLMSLLEGAPYAFQCDVWRTLAVYNFGGVYADLDNTFHGNIDLAIYDTSFVTAVQQDDFDKRGFGLHNGFFGATAGHDALWELHEYQVRTLSERTLETYDDYMDAVGVSAYNKVLEDFTVKQDSTIRILPREYVLPYGYWEVDSPNINKCSIMCHHWNHADGADKRARDVT
jgi:hypothetical protein